MQKHHGQGRKKRQPVNRQAKARSGGATAVGNSRLRALPPSQGGKAELLRSCMQRAKRGAAPRLDGVQDSRAP